MPATRAQMLKAPPAELRRAAAVQLILLALLGVVLGLACSRYVLVGSGLSLIPWALAAFLIGSRGRSTRRAVVDAAAFGFALAFSFMCFGYQGRDPLTTRILPFSVLGIVGAASALLLALAGHRITGRRRP